MVPEIMFADLLGGSRLLCLAISAIDLRQIDKIGARMCRCDGTKSQANKRENSTYGTAYVVRDAETDSLCHKTTTNK